MQPKLADVTPELPFDLPPLAQWLNPNEPLKILANTIDCAIEPAIGHMKSDGFLGRNYLKGEISDAINAVMCGVGWNLRKLLRYLRERFLLLLFAFGRAQHSPYGAWYSVLAMMATFLCCQNKIIIGNSLNCEPLRTI